MNDAFVKRNCLLNGASRIEFWRSAVHVYAASSSATLLTATDSASTSGGIQRANSHDQRWNAPRRPDKSRLVYVVDDTPSVTELYALLLDSVGCFMEAFADRSLALSALKRARQKPDLMITDYLRFDLPIEFFLRRCLIAHSSLRILVATGYPGAESQLGGIRPLHFLRKPFTIGEFERAVSAALTPRSLIRE